MLNGAAPAPFSVRPPAGGFEPRWGRGAWGMREHLPAKRARARRARSGRPRPARPTSLIAHPGMVNGAAPAPFSVRATCTGESSPYREYGACELRGAFAARRGRRRRPRRVIQVRGRSFSRSWRRIAVWGKPIPANGPLPPRFGLAEALPSTRSGNWSARHMVQGTFFRFSTPEIAPNRAPAIAPTSFPSALLSPNGDFLP